MYIDELISRLKAMQNEYGDVDVKVRNAAGEFRDAGTIYCKHYDVNWTVFIEGDRSQ